MYFLYYAAIGTVKKKERRKQSDNVLVELWRHRYCTEKKKGDTNVTMSWLYYAAIGNRV